MKTRSIDNGIFFREVERLLDEGINLAELFSSRLLGADGIGFVETLVGDFDDAGNESLVLRGGLPS